MHKCKHVYVFILIHDPRQLWSQRKCSSHCGQYRTNRNYLACAFNCPAASTNRQVLRFTGEFNKLLHVWFCVRLSKFSRPLVHPGPNTSSYERAPMKRLQFPHLVRIPASRSAFFGLKLFPTLCRFSLRYTLRADTTWYVERSIDCGTSSKHL